MFSYHKICVLTTLFVAMVHADNETPRNLRDETYGGDAFSAFGGLSNLGGQGYGGASTGFSALSGLSALGGLLSGLGGQGYGGTTSTTEGATTTGYGGLPSTTSDTAISPIAGSAGAYPGTGVAATSSVLPNSGPAPVQAADLPSTDVPTPVNSAATPQSGTDQTGVGY